LPFPAKNPRFLRVSRISRPDHSASSPIHQSPPISPRIAPRAPSNAPRHLYGHPPLALSVPVAWRVCFSC
jgi:hypothetical protein